MTTNTATKPAQKNIPAFEVFYVEERKLDATMAKILGESLAENAVKTTWHKVGVAFVTKGQNLSILIGKQGDPAQRKYLAIQTSLLEEAKKSPDAQRLPVGNLWQQDAQGNVDFAYQDGVMFLNSDDSYTLVLQDGDTKTRYQMRRVQPKQSRQQPMQHRQGQPQSAA
jgi:aspartate-semialdehyde dehydrogenase